MIVTVDSNVLNVDGQSGFGIIKLQEYFTYLLAFLINYDGQTR